VREILSGIWREREQRGAREADLLEALHELYRDAPEATRHERVARDVIILHLASQSNLYAAISWTLVNLLLHPQWQTAVQEDPALLEACALESIRLARFELTPRFQRAEPKPGQMGAVARAAEPCPVRYRRRD